MLYTLVIVIISGSVSTPSISVERGFKNREACHAAGTIAKEIAQNKPFITLRYRCVEEK